MNTSWDTRALIATAPLVLLLSACVVTPTWKKLAATGDLESFLMETDWFQHVVLANDAPGPHLRIYVEGDGSPWIRGSRVAVDPTPLVPVMLELMHDAPHSAAYLGRPCYFGLATSRNCESRWWTVDRYADTVVDSMCAAANALSAARDAETVQLVGYSGGGTIVTRMAGCTDRVVSVVTIAANLDPEHWASHHGYSPLRAQQIPDLPAEVREIHWQCQDDRNVPPSVTDGYFDSRPNAERIVIERCSHSSGWEEVWPRIVDLVSAT